MENINCVILGDKYVGKTSLIERYINNNFNSEYYSTNNEVYQNNLVYQNKHISLTIIEPN